MRAQRKIEKDDDLLADKLPLVIAPVSWNVIKEIEEVSRRETDARALAPFSVSNSSLRVNRAEVDGIILCNKDKRTAY